MDMIKYPMVEALVEELRAYAFMTADPLNEFDVDRDDPLAGGYGTTTDEVITKIKNEFDTLGPYEFAKSRHLLVNESGEEFACQFMAFYNEFAGYQVY